MSETGKFFSVVVVAAVVSGLAFAAVRLWKDEERRARTDSDVYDLSAYMDVPAESIGYREAGRITGLDGVTGIALDADGSVYAAAGKTIAVFDSKGNRVRTIELQEPGRCAAVDETGAVYVGMRNHIEVCAPSGERRAQWTGLGETAEITSIAVSGDDVFAADYGGRLVWRFDRSGRLLGTIGKGTFVVPSPFFDVATGPDGSLWAANTGKRRIEKFTRDGTPLASWGTSSMDLEGFCGCCNPSHFAIGPDGSFVTSEKGLPRIKVYDRDGKFSCVVAGPKSFQEGTTGIDLAVGRDGRVFAAVPNEAAILVFEKKRGS